MKSMTTTSGSGNFVHLHTHTAKGSLLDSILTVEEMVEFAKKSGQSAMAITDHGKMYAYVDFWKECTKNNIKPIIGCEFYEVEDLEFAMKIKNSTEKNKPKLKRYHLIVLAKNKTGFENLLKLNSDSHTKFQYTKPLIDLKYIRENNLGDGLICLTACYAGRLSKMLTSKEQNLEEIINYKSQLQDTFEDVYFEVQSHGSQDQFLANRKIIDFAKSQNVPYVMTCDAHMLNSDDTEAHDIFIYLGQDREVGETYRDCYLQTKEDIQKTIGNTMTKQELDYAINQSVAIADSIDEYDIGVGQPEQMPEVTIPKMFNGDMLKYYDYLIESGFKAKGHDRLDKEEIKKRKDRLNQEREVLIYLDFIKYFLNLYVMINEFRENSIPLNYNRGSGGNCLSLYYLNVTQIDSIKWDLDFSRFANKGRKGSSADYDIDISKRRRHEAIEIMVRLFGKDKVAPICTFNSFSTKVAIRDIGKVLHEKEIYNIPYDVRNEVAKQIPTIKTLNDLGEESEKELLLKEVLRDSHILTMYYEKYPLWFKYVMKLEGLPKSRGKHAGGILVTPKPLVEYCPLCLDSDGEFLVQLEMNNAMDDLGLVKYDILGLKTLDVVDDTIKFIGKTWEDFDIDHINLMDKDVFKNIYSNGNTFNIFQFESYECIDMCKMADVDNIEDVIAINAFNRPGTKAQFPMYVYNKKNPSTAKILHDDLSDILKVTHKVLLYQEQVLKILGFAGLDESEQDRGRRAMGKKKEKEMNKLRPQIEFGLKNLGWSDEKILELWELLVQQSKYNFNRGHAVSYSLLSYLTAMLKYYYPVEFMTACLNNESDYGKISKILTETKRMKINVKPPLVNKSMEYFTPNAEKNEILFGVYPIKSVGEKAGSQIISMYPYESFEDFLNSNTKTGSKANVKAIVALIKAGYFGKNKSKVFKEYFSYTFDKKNKSKLEKEFVPKKTIGMNLKELKEKYDIEEKDKAKRLELFNIEKEIEFYKDKEELKLSLKEEKKQQGDDFKKKYMQNKDMWEFESMSMFITSNPLEKSKEFLKKEFQDYEIGNNSICVGAICKIDKKGSGNKQNAFVEVYTTDGIVEIILWSSVYKRYANLIERGNRIIVQGRKEDDNKIVANKVKDYVVWYNQKLKQKEVKA